MTVNKEPSETEKCIIILRAHGFYREANEMKHLAEENGRLKNELGQSDIPD